MARVLDPTFIPTNTNTAATAWIALDDIPQEIKDEVEAIYTGLKNGAQGRMRVGFDTKDELALYTLQVQSYCAQRPDGELRFRKSPTRKNSLPVGHMDFRIGDPRTEDAAETAEQAEATTPVATVPANPPMTIPAKKATPARRR